ncbi:MAG: tRNA (N6-threonylcarbamoyladenosine(37)-N6)-methyltransferase TrmO [Acidobacteria bacterium]|nr:MAG: tRNA (N6-threonylcarbamoyladenosine(37)-N6)-methyltransferase TrmO [Acidobacteriota bacterium]
MVEAVLSRDPRSEIRGPSDLGPRTSDLERHVHHAPHRHVGSPYTETAQIPKGPGAEHRAEGVLEILPAYEQGLMDIDGFSHLYVLWVFDRAAGSSLIATPPLDNRPHGVFATRSPQRPNPIGLTVVALMRREGTKLFVRGIDMLDGTPILDIKPYLSSVPDAELRRGWLTAIDGGAPPVR